MWYHVFNIWHLGVHELTIEGPGGRSMGASIYYVGLACSSTASEWLLEHPFNATLLASRAVIYDIELSSTSHLHPCQ